jgi:hypothetical protein
MTARQEQPTMHQQRTERLLQVIMQEAIEAFNASNMELIIFNEPPALRAET